MTAAATEIIQGASAPSVRRFSVRVLQGFDLGCEAASEAGRLTVGTDEGATLRLTDRTVSRFHAEFESIDGSVVLRDLGSSNGTRVGAVGVREVLFHRDAEVMVGRTRLALTLTDRPVAIELTVASQFGRLMGNSMAMRAVFAALARAAPTSAPVLLTGESGTGKELAARALHDASPRAGRPFEVVDCGGLAPTLIESELFGHERGAFTGAHADKVGAFERADGGTVFLDELGELPVEVQPKLLRVLAEGEIRRVGSVRGRNVDVRVVAATHRDLRREINVGRFRADLFYRLAVIQVRMPALRDRLEDLPLLVPTLLAAIERERGVEAEAAPDSPLWAELAQHDWPGNVRELRNHLEQWAILREATLVPMPSTASPGAAAKRPASEGIPELEAAFVAFEPMPLRAAREVVLDRFDRHYLTRLLQATAGNATEAARRAGVDRVTMFRLLRRLGLPRG
ncbi:MAG: sigma 54-dependent Fis family transcriptional regulator [Deltaproteobacteria bacterium]|nr:sigma 54-dependent Fis family transcriptional regulator [Deltaproteobacteria bacterium]MBP6833830.1 sigma 54-dependent Fis family transcriptional regulator [Deltaproteobacteria bacterium]